MLGDTNVQPMLPVKDLEAAKKFYEEKLGLKRVGEEPGAALVYQSGNGTLCVYLSRFAGTNQGTAALWEVGDVEGTVKELKDKGVSFEHYDNLPETTRTDDIHRAGDIVVAWFKDPDGNILSVQNRPARPAEKKEGADPGASKPA
jgi:catechol 2,3-dioxygenase-like lactoylglutathione lyase family enzyme